MRKLKLITERRQKIIATKIHKYVNNVCTLAPYSYWFVSVERRLWDKMEEILQFSSFTSDVKLEPEEEVDDAETLKLIRRLSTLEEVGFLIVYFKLYLPLVVTIVQEH